MNAGNGNTLPMGILDRFNWIPAKGKFPLVKWTEFITRDASDAEREIWEREYASSDRGIVCGPTSGLLVLDDDGSEELKKFHIPYTATVITPRGGKHYYFKWTSELDNKITTKVGILPHADVRGQGGFVMFYGWTISPTIAPIALPPQWLIDLLPDKEAKVIQDKPENWMIEELENIKPGSGIDGRTPTFVRAIGRLKTKGLSEVEVKKLLAPWAAKYDYPKLDSLVVDQFNRYPQRSESLHVDKQGESIEAFLADHQPIKWICEPFIAEQSIGFIAGLPESRKSWILIDLAIECARGGGLWLNKFPVESSKVLLIDQERSKGEVQRRIQAVLAGKGLRAADIGHRLFIRSGTSTRIDLQNSYDSLRKEMADLKPNLVLIDSFATFHTKNESNRMEIQQVLERIKEIRNEFSCTIILIHHETKQAYQNKKDGQESSYLDMAGNVAIPAAAEMCINVCKHDGESSFVYHTKSTQGPKAPPFLVQVRDLKSDKSQISVEAH